MSVTLDNGIDTLNARSLGNGSPIAGSTISRLLADKTIKQVLGLQGNEAVEVSVNGVSWTAVSSSYKIPDGCRVRFSRAAGEKGFAILVVA